MKIFFRLKQQRFALRLILSRMKTQSPFVKKKGE